MIKIDLAGGNGVSSLIPKARAADAAIKKCRDVLQVMLDDATEQYVLERLHEAVELNQALEVYIVANSVAILAPWSNSGRIALAKEIDAVFLAVSNINFKQINIINEQAYTATQTLLKTLETFQSLFPMQIDKNLAGAQAALSKKIKAYQPEEHVEHKPAEEVVVIDVAPEPSNPIKDDDCEREGLNDVASRENVWMDPVQVMTIIAALSIMQPSSTRVSIVMTLVLLSHMILSMKLTGKRPDTFAPLIRTFEQEADPQPQVIALIDKLDTANKTYQANGNLEMFQETVEQDMDNFTHQVDFKENASDSWFQKYIIKPFERFKRRVNELIQSMRRTIPESTGDQLGFFNARPTEVDPHNLDKKKDVKTKSGGEFPTG